MAPGYRSPLVLWGPIVHFDATFYEYFQGTPCRPTPKKSSPTSSAGNRAGRAWRWLRWCRHGARRPVPEGSHLAVNDRGEFVGSVSGGCIEGAVVTEALAAITDGKPRTLEFGVSDEQAWEVGLACGGQGARVRGAP